MAELWNESASGLVRLIRSEAVSAVEVAESCLARTREREADVHAWAWLDDEAVLEQARQLDRARNKGPLHGVPVGVKDVIDTKDMPTQHNSPLYSGSRPTNDAACVQTLRAAGAVIFGKTVTTEFAASQKGGPTRNPHDLERTPGGSSSGSGAAVADGHVPIALATQTGGSTIRPGSYNGIVAMKPTLNAVSREGLKMFVPTTDTIGLCVRDVHDLELLSEVYQFPDRSMPAGHGGLTVGVYRSPAWGQAEPATETTLRRAADRLEAAGLKVIDFDLSGEFEDALEVFSTVLRGESRASFLHEARMHPRGLRDEFMSFIDERNPVRADELVAALDKAARLRQEFDAAAATVDVVLTPSTTGEAPEGIAFTGDPAFCSMWSLLQTPVINLPGFTGPAGMPVGLSLVSPRFTDRHLIRVASQVAPVFQDAREPAGRS